MLSWYSTTIKWYLVPATPENCMILSDSVADARYHLMVVKYQDNIYTGYNEGLSLLGLTWELGSYLLIHILKLNPIKTGNLAKQVPSTC